MANDTRKYLEDLTFQLRLTNIPGKRIGDIVAEVESHVADSAENPWQAFGSPKEYANSFKHESKRRSEDVQETLISIGVGAGAGFLTASGIFGVFTDQGTFGLEPIYMLLIGLVFLGLLLIWMRRTVDPIEDPRTGQQQGPSIWWVSIGVVAFILAVPAALGLVIELLA